MTLEQAIKHGKEHRKPYYRSARFDETCRPHGSCGYCRGNRLHQATVKEYDAADQLKEEEGVRYVRRKNLAK